MYIIIIPRIWLLQIVYLHYLYLHIKKIKNTLYIIKLCDLPIIPSMNNTSFVKYEAVILTFSIVSFLNIMYTNHNVQHNRT